MKYYKPEIQKEQALPLEKEELSYAPRLLQATEDGLIKVKLEEDVIIQRVSHDLYKNPESGVREYFNNEARACRIAKKLGANPTLHVTLNIEERKLIIEGIDSMGISQEKFLEIYTVLGRSDNFSGEEIGMFGLGRNAYTTLSDSILIETYSREDGTKYAVMGKGGIAFNLLPQPKIESYGTRVTLIIRTDVLLDRIVDYIKKLGRFAGIPVIYTQIGNLDDYERKGGVYTLGPISFVDYLLDKYNVDSYNRGIKLLYSISISDEDLDFVGFILSNHPYYSLRHRELLLLGTPIEDGGLFYNLPFDMAILNIKNERKYMPTADRERLRKEAEDAVRQRLNELLSEKMTQDFAIHSMDEWLNSKYRGVFPMVGNSELVLDTQANQLCELLNTQAHVYKGNTGRFCHLLKEADWDWDKFYYSPTYNAKDIAILLAIEPNAKIFRFHNDTDQQLRTHNSALAKYFGIKFLEDAIQMANIKVELPPTVYISGKGYTCFGALSRRVARPVDYIPENSTVIIVPKGKLKKCLTILRNLDTKYALALKRKNTKGLGLSVEEFISDMDTRKINGMEYREIAKLNKVKLIVYSDPKVANYLPEFSIISENQNQLFELGIYLVMHGCDVEIDNDGRFIVQWVYSDNDLNKGLLRGYYKDYIQYTAGLEPGDSEILYSVVQVDKEVKNEDLKSMYFSALINKKDPEAAKTWRKIVLRGLI